MDPFRGYSRSKSKVARNRSKFWTIFGPPKFMGASLPKIVHVYHSCLAARRLKKFHEDTPTSPEVIEPNMLNFRPVFKFLLLIFFWGGGEPRPPCGCALASLGQSLARVKI